MSVSYYFFNWLRDYKSKEDAFLTSLVCRHAVYWRR